MDTSSDSSPLGFAVVEHTADIGLRVWGSGFGDILEQAAAGLAQLLVEPSGVHAREERAVAIDCVDMEEGLVSLLQEILYLYEIGRFVPLDASMTTATHVRIQGVVRGESFSTARHRTLLDVKAVTYHDLRIERVALPDGKGERWSATIIFDI
jgi:SHS2 domain-containing protein